MKNLFRSKNHRGSFSNPNSSRSSSVTSGTDSGIENNSLDGDINRLGPPTLMMTGKSQAESASGQSSKFLNASIRTNFRVEHLASFPLEPGDRVVSAKERLQKAKELITKGEPWTKEMELSVTDKELVLLDCETQELIERYPLSHIDSVQDINDDPLLNSVLVFSTTQTPEKYAAVHLFQCDKIPASVIAPEVQKLISKPRESPKMNGEAHRVPVLPPPPQQPAPQPPQPPQPPQGVAAFTAAVAHKEKNVPRPPSSPTKVIHGEKYGEISSPELMEAYINRDVQILNHCIDDIEELVYRVKQVAEAWKQFEMKGKSKKSKYRKQEAEAIEARSPSRAEFIDAFEKCKYSFILLGKLRPHIQNPSAAELVHYLIMPLSLLVRCTRGPQEASMVTQPLMTSEGVGLLHDSLTSKEAEFWHSLGPAWTLSKSNPHWSNMHMVHYEPKFRSGWVPPEIVGSGRSVPPDVSAAVAANAAARAVVDRTKRGDKEDVKNSAAVLAAAAKFKSSNEPKSLTDSPSKGEIFKRVKALYSFNGKNPKELSVNQGEELMILDDSRQWWCVRNSSGAVGFVPNTILNKSGSLDSSVQSHLSSTSLPTSPAHTSSGNVRRHGSSSSDSSLPVFSNQSSLSQDGFSRLASKPESPTANGGNSFQSMIQTRAVSLKKVEDVPDGKQAQNKRLSSADLLNNELKNKISSERPLSPTPNRINSQESAIILSKQSTASEVQNWMKSKNFSPEAMKAVKPYSAEQLGEMSRSDIAHLVGDSEGKKLYTQLTIEKSGDCWHQIVVHRGVSELQAVMNRRRNLSESDGPVEREQGIRNIVKAAQSDRQNTWIEKKLTRRPSLENFQDYNEKKSTSQELTRQTSYELRKKPPENPMSSPTRPKPSTVVPPVAPKPRPPSITIPPPPLPPTEYDVPVFSPNSSQLVGVPPAPVLSPSDVKIDELLREHQRQQELLKEQQRQLTELRTQQQQKEEIKKYEESRIRLEQQVKDQEAMLKLFREQQKQQQQTQVTPQLQPAIQPQGTYVSYVPVQAMPGVQAIPGVQGIQATPPIYTIPQVYGTVPPTLGFQHK